MQNIPETVDGPKPDAHPIDRWIPWMFVAFFAVVFVVNGIFLYFAQTTHTGVVRDRAYEVGIAYNDVVAASEARDALGWQSTMRATEEQLVFTLADDAGEALSGATVTARVKRPVVDGHDFELTLQDMGRGTYRSFVEWPLAGQWDVIIDVERGLDAFQARERILLP